MRLTKKQLLASLREDIYVRLGRSSVHGVGIFAIRTIPKGINPFNAPKNTAYYRYKKQELTGIPEEVMRMIDDYCVEKNGYKYIPSYGFNPIQIDCFLNHSEKPNVLTDDGGYTFYTARIIKKGEELFSDFTTYHDGNEEYYKSKK